MRDVIPPLVFEAIQRHIIGHTREAEKGWEAGQDEEDTLTGHLGASLQRDWSRPIVAGGETWRWRARYKKFRGRGKGAFEKKSGADGIVQVELWQPDTETTVYKSILFQAKKTNGGRDGILVGQVRSMERIAPGGSAVFLYRREGFFGTEGAALLRDVDAARSHLRDGPDRLGPFLADRFLPCSVGLRGMYYDGVRRALVVPDLRSGTRLVHPDLPHRIDIQLESTARRPRWRS